MQRFPQIEQIGRLDQPGMRHRDRMNGAFDLFLPEAEELHEVGEQWKHIVLLPDELLQQLEMIGNAVDDLRGGQAKSQIGLRRR